MAGRHPPNFKQKNDFEGNLRTVPCTKEHEEHIGADQIFTHIRTENWYTPTVIHNCPRTITAAALRACSNKVWYCEIMMKRFKTWFREEYIPDFMKYLGEELHRVNFEDWLKRYKEDYQRLMRASIDVDRATTLGMLDTDYGLFPKAELQYCTVHHCCKDTACNDSKERCIFVPLDEKKVYGNAFINLLEGIASDHMKEYCGRANWIEICDSLDKLEADLGIKCRLNGKRIIWGASDGSGFDMTQYPECNRLMNELILTAARHPNMHWDEPLDYDRLQESLEGSLQMKVSGVFGDLKFECIGRASGDGWTTFGNTILMIAYWKFTMKLAGIKDYILKVKGDDVLFAIAEGDRPALEKAIALVFTNRKDKHEHGLGQICKKVDFGDLTELDFLSNEFFVTKEGKYRMTRIPARVIQTNSWSMKVPKGASPKTRLEARQQLCYSKGMCLKAWANDLPIFGKLAQKMIELGKYGKLSEFNEHSDGARKWHQGRDDAESYYVYLEQKYNLSKQEVDDAERRIGLIRSLDDELYIPAFEKFYDPKCVG